MKTRKKELDKIVKLLEQEHEDVHELESKYGNWLMNYAENEKCLLLV